MKALILSDIHNARKNAVNVIRENKDSDAIIFLGDGEKNFELAMAACGLDISGTTKQEVWQVAGNCDWDSSEFTVKITEFANTRIYISHGHGEGVKSRAGIESLAEIAGANGCKIAFFGHTHRQFKEERNGVVLFNPGAVLNGEYGIIQIEDGDIRCVHRRI